MKRSWASIMVLCLLLGALVTPSHAGGEATSEERARVTWTSRAELLRRRAAATHTSGSVLVSFEENATRAEKMKALTRVDGKVVDGLEEVGIKVLEVDPGDEQAAVEDLVADPAIEIAELDTPRIPLGIPDDPLFDTQWGFRNVSQEHPIADPIKGFKTFSGKRNADADVNRAWNDEDGSSNETVIAVLDQGFDITHPDIDTNRWIHPQETMNGLDDDGNGYDDDLRGWDFEDNDPEPKDERDAFDQGHGTHVAAIAAGVSDNGKGIAGVCPGCKILPLRFGLTLKQELEAINYLINTIKANPDANIKVLNASFGSWSWSALERKALARLGRKGVLTVAAAGNGGLDNDMFDAADFEPDGIPDDFSPLFPASYSLDTVMSVAATNDKDQLGYFTGCDRTYPRYRCFFSNYGRTSVDVGAPGTDIQSAYLTTNGGKPRYETWNGTSMAAPFVAGVAGLIAAKYPGYGPLALKNAVMNSVDQPGSLKKVWRRPGSADKGSFLRTNGRVDARSALDGDRRRATTVTDGMIRGARWIKRIRNDSVRWPADVNDVYTKRLKKGVDYVATLRATHPDRNIDLVVFKPGTKDVWQLEDGCFGGSGRCSAVQPFRGLSPNGSERVRFKAWRKGKYFFLVSSYFVQSGYRLRIVRAR